MQLTFKRGKKMFLPEISKKLKINVKQIDTLVKQKRFPEPDGTMNTQPFWLDKTVDLWLAAQPASK